MAQKPISRILGFLKIERSVPLVWIGVWLIATIALLMAFFFVQPPVEDIERNTEQIHRYTLERGKSVTAKFFDDLTGDLQLLLRVQKTGVPLEEMLPAFRLLGTQHVSAIAFWRPGEQPPLSFSEAELAGLQGDTSRHTLLGDVRSEDGSRKLDIAATLPEEGSGVAVARVSLDALLQRLSALSRPSEGRFYVVDSHGGSIVHEEVEGASSVLSREVVSLVIEGQSEVAGFTENSSYENEEGKTMQALGSPLPPYGAGVFFERPEGLIFAPQEQLIRATLVWVVIVGVALFVMARILLALRGYQKALEETNTVLEIKVRARTQELQELASRLEERVQERTQELEEKVKELERFQKLAVGREMKMVELKKEVKRLTEELKKQGSTDA